MHNIFSQSTKKEIFDLERLLSGYKEERGRRMTDYEFVKSIYDNDGCRGKSGVDCTRCPLRNGSCIYYAEICVRAKLWLEAHKKENAMDGIKVTVEEKKAEEKAKYPCYKMADGEKGDRAIVLFTAPSKGVVVVTSDVHKTLGAESSVWAESRFKPFHGTIKIEVE